MLKCNYFGIDFKNPVIAASGTFGFGQEYRDYYDPSILGGISTKGITLEPRAGNSGIRIAETGGGVMNSIGLENPGIAHFLAHELQEMRNIDTVRIANLGGSSLDSYIEGARLIQAHNDQKDDRVKVDIVELNISCPNVKEGGIAFGMTCHGAARVVSAIRQEIKMPLVVKLSPNADDIVRVAMYCEENGADGISLINTFSSMKVNLRKKSAEFDNIYAGLSGPAIKPIALKMTREVCKAVRIPVMGMGGIVDYADALEFIMVGAHMVQFGTASFMNPFAGKDIIEGMTRWMQEEKVQSLNEIRGII